MEHGGRQARMERQSRDLRSSRRGLNPSSGIRSAGCTRTSISNVDKLDNVTYDRLMDIAAHRRDSGQM